MSSKHTLGRIFLTGASLAAMGALNPAFAQEEDVSDEIVVTATGRAAAIQDVPLAVTAIGADTLENTGVQDLRDVTQVAPSLVIGTGQSSSSGTIAYIRGIGTGSDNPGFEGAVGIFIDGVYRARAGAALADLPELVRVEVLRGPQGTLFGRNTSAGAISVVTAGPQFDPGMYIEALFGIEELEEYGARAGVNIPVSDNLAFRFDGTIRDRDGYITDLISGDEINTTNRWTARGQALWDITPDASLRIIVDGAESDEVCCGITPLQYNDTQGAISLLTGGLGTPAIDLEGRGMTVTPGRGYGEATDEWGISGELNWNIGGMTLTSITAYRDWSATRDQDVDFNFIDIAYRDGLDVGFKNFTQEIRLQGENGPVDWLVGVFFGDEQLRTQDAIRVGSDVNAYVNVVTQGAALPGGPYQFYNFSVGVPSFFALANPGLAGTYLTPNVNGQGQQSDRWSIDTQSISLFTHNEISLSENMILTVGARYNMDEKDLGADLFATSSSCTSLQGIEFGTGAVSGLEAVASSNPAFAGIADLLNLSCNPAINPIANGEWEGSREENEFSGTASLAYFLNDDVMVYGGYSRGYKAGGFNVDRSGFAIRPSTIDPTDLNVSQLEFEPEFTDAFEIGLKSTIFGGTTTANLAIFYQQIHDYQSNNFNGFNFITENVPEVISQGAEFEFTSRPTDNLTLNGGVVYTDAYYDSEVRFSPLTQALGDADPNAIFAGQPLTQVAEWTVTGGVTYEMPIANDYRALFYLDGRWNSGYRVQTLARNPVSDNDAFAIFNGRISFGPESQRWAIDLWGQNLTDELYNVGAFQPPLQDTTVIYPNAPRTYGVTLRARY